MGLKTRLGKLEKEALESRRAKLREFCLKVCDCLKDANFQPKNVEVLVIPEDHQEEAMKLCEHLHLDYWAWINWVKSCQELEQSKPYTLPQDFPEPPPHPVETLALLKRLDYAGLDYASDERTFFLFWLATARVRNESR